MRRLVLAILCIFASLAPLAPAGAQSARAVTLIVFLQSGTYAVTNDRTCAGTDSFTKIEVGEQQFTLFNGKQASMTIEAKTTAGCRITLNAPYNPGTSIVIRIGETTLGTVTDETLTNLGDRLEMTIARDGSFRGGPTWRLASPPKASVPPTEAPGSTQATLQNVDIDVFLQSYETFSMEDDGSCSGIGDYTTLTFGDQVFDLRDGTRKMGKKSPTKKTGCLITLTAKGGNAASITVILGTKRVGTLTQNDLEDLDYLVQLVATGETIQAGPEWRLGPPPTPTPEPSPTQAPAPDLGPVPGSDTYIIGGTLELYGTSGDEFSVYSGACYGNGGYDDIGVGTQVVVSDQSGDIVGVGNLEPDPDAGPRDCKFVFYIEVPDSRFYSISITHRGEMVYSKAELEDQGWLVELSLG